MQQPSPNQGTLKSSTEDCMGYTNGNDKKLADTMNAFNHSIQNCWYLSKHGQWQSGSGSVSSAKNDCEKVYEQSFPHFPRILQRTIGRMYVRPGTVNSIQAMSEDAGMRAPRVGTLTAIRRIDTELKAYCGMIEIPEVVDPSDQVGDQRRFLEHPGRADRLRGSGAIGRALAGDDRQSCGFCRALGHHPGDGRRHPHRRHDLQRRRQPQRVRPSGSVHSV